MSHQHPYLPDRMKTPFLLALLNRIFGFGRIAFAHASKYPRSRACFTADSRRGLSLIEIMIALTMTLIVLGAMMTAFQSVSQQMQSGRAMIELASRVRNIESTLRSDLGNLTVEPRPYTTTIPPGYFQIVEGPRTDSLGSRIPNVNPLFVIETMRAPNDVNIVVGDLDDTLSMTVQTRGRLFRGRFNGQIVESPVAEVVWFPVWNNPDPQDGIPVYEEKFEIRRRQLLVLPNPAILRTNITWVEVRRFFLDNDVSARILPSLTSADQYDIVANQLADLAVRKNRFGHLPAFDNGINGVHMTWPQPNPWLGLPTLNGPYPINDPSNPNANGFPNQQHYKVLRALSSPLGLPLNLQRSGDSEIGVVLTDVVSFDVRVFSPNAHVKLDQDLTQNPQPIPNIVLEPGDFVDVNTANTFPYVVPNTPNPGITIVDSGAFVDLGFTDLRNRNPDEPPAWFSGRPSLVLGNLPVGANWPFSTYPPDSLHTLLEYVFDTWTPFYESDGIDQDRSGLPDQGTDGLDSNNQNGVDDIGERETRPPYNYPIRGIEIRIRTVEKTTKQVHQTTVLHSFVPE